MQLSDDIIEYVVAPFLNTSHLLRVRVTSKAFCRALSQRVGNCYRLTDSDLWAVQSVNGEWMVNDRRVAYYRQYGSKELAEKVDKQCDNEIRAALPRWIPSGRCITSNPTTYIVRNDGRIYMVDKFRGVIRMSYANDKGSRACGESILVKFTDGHLCVFTNDDHELHHEGLFEDIDFEAKNAAIR